MILKARPAVGSVFTNWSGACTGVGLCELTLNADTSVTANFRPQFSGWYSGEIPYPATKTRYASCSGGSQYVQMFLLESAEGAIDGHVNWDIRVVGTRVGSVVTVEVVGDWGVNGPYVWQWNGKSNTLSGTFFVRCGAYPADFGAEATYNFTITYYSRAGIAYLAP